MSDAGDSTPKRVIGRPFPKGVSGNPSGVPKAFHDARKALEAAVPGAIAKMIELSTCGDPKIEALAARDILDRTLGKAKESVEIKSDANTILASLIAAMRPKEPEQP
jgi:hypothetical protein